eukprot:4911182-Ditylum_brightwellii.AAC.1
MYGDEKNISISKGDQKIVFDIIIPTKEGLFFAAYIEQYNPTEMANAGLEVPKKVNVNKAHALLGHSNEERTRMTAKHLGWIITRGKMKPCESCTVGKARQKNAKKQSNHEKADMPGNQTFTDISTIKGKNNGPTLEKFSQWEKNRRKVEFVRCDNAGENKTLEKRSKSKDWKMNLQFEFTARATPQQNHLAELAFSTLGSK